MFKPRPYDPERKNKQTPAHAAATERNFRIFRLHGLHAQMNLMTGPRRELARLLVDQELIAMGAATTQEVREDRHSNRNRRLENAPCDCGSGIQFIECDCIPF